MKPLMPSRGMISGEISWAFFAFVTAFAGSPIPPFGGGWLYMKLAEHASPFLWCALVGIPAIALLVVDVREIRAHRAAIAFRFLAWTTEQIEQSAMIRGRLCLASILGWGYMLYVLALDLSRASSILTPIAVGGLVFMWWFYKENRRVRREIRNSHVPCRVVAQG